MELQHISFQQTPIKLNYKIKNEFLNFQLSFSTIYCFWKVFYALLKYPVSKNLLNQDC